jgi:hypothetical protein
MAHKSICNKNVSVNKTIFYRRYTTCFGSLDTSSGLYRPEIRVDDGRTDPKHVVWLG